RASRPPPRSPPRILGSPLAALGLRPGLTGCIPITGRVAPPRTPFFRRQVPADRLLDLMQRRGHPEPWRLDRSPLVIVEDPPHRRAIVEHHRAGGIDLGSRPIRRRRGRRAGGFRGGGRDLIPGLGLLPLEPGLFDRPQATDFLPHLN